MLLIGSACLLIYLLVLAPVLENHAFAKFLRDLPSHPNARINLYRQACLTFTFLGILLLIFAKSQNIPYADLGLRTIDVHYFSSLSPYVQILSIGYLAWYIIYFFIFVIVAVRLNQRLRNYFIRKVKAFHFIAPQTLKESLWWVATCMSAAGEELVYRGFIFYCGQHFLPNIPIGFIALFSIALEVLRHAPYLKSMKYATYSGISFTLSFLIFNSLYPAIIFHVIYDLRMLAMPFHWVREQQVTA
jgi:hypothetical protein